MADTDKPQTPPRKLKLRSKKGPRQGHGPNHRVKKRNDFLRLQSEGRKVRAFNLLLVFAERRPYVDKQTGVAETITTADSRLGITVTKKIDKRAARRNRLKRRIREIFRRERGRFLFAADVVVIALDGAMELEFLELRRQLRFAFGKARILPQKR